MEVGSWRLEVGGWKLGRWLQSVLGMDADLRRMLTWVLVALIGTVAFALAVVEATLRWFRP